MAKYKIKILIFSLILFVLACVFPALTLKSGSGRVNTLYGLDCLLTGFLGALAGIFGWYANCFYSFSILLMLMKKWQAAVYSGVIAILLGLSTICWFFQDVPIDEGGTRSRLIFLEAAYYLWMFCITLIPAYSYLVLKEERNAKQGEPGQMNDESK